jgi:outer membrane protein TolC
LTTEIVKKTASGSRFTFTNNTSYERWNGPFPAGSSVGPFRRVNSAWETEFEVRWDQPLLRGRGTMINRIPILLARINEDLSLADFESAVRDLVLDVEDTYWELHRAYRNLETAKIGRDSGQVTWKLAYEKWKEGVEPVQAEAQAREQYFNFRAEVERSLQQLYGTETRLRWLMGLTATDGRLIRPIDEPTIARVDFDWAAIRTEALVRSPELRQQRWLVKSRELELASAKNQLLPVLDMGLLYRWVGLGDELIKANRTGKDFATSDGIGTTAFEELTGGKYQEAQIFFDLRLPIGFRRELAGVRNAQLKLAREKARLEDMELQQVHLLSTGVRDVDAHHVQAETHFNSWSAAEKEVEAVDALYKGGKITVNDVLEAQRRRAQTQIAYYNSLVEFNKAIAKVHWHKGSLLEYNNIELAEGPWPQKAYWDALQLARQRDASYYFDYGWTRPNVVSRGPVPQGVGGGMPVEDMLPAETIPTPEPTPAQQKSPPAAGSGAENPLTLPSPEPDPVTRRSEMPLLNAPAIRTADASRAGQSLGNPLRGPSPAVGSRGLDPLRSPSVEVDSQVRPAAYVSTISDSQ